MYYSIKLNRAARSYLKGIGCEGQNGIRASSSGGHYGEDQGN
jgi:hypothetical protein